MSRGDRSAGRLCGQGGFVGVRHVLTVLAVSIVGVLAMTPVASAATFSNMAPIAINDGATATPYPSPISAAGVTDYVRDVNVTIYGYSHTRPGDVGVELVAPDGKALQLMNCVGAEPDAVSANITFDDAAAFMSSTEAPTSGSFMPTSYCAGSGRPLSSPAPIAGNPGPGGANSGWRLASAFDGVAANGTWGLYVEDFVAGNAGSIAGWALDLDTSEPVPEDGDDDDADDADDAGGTGQRAKALKKCKKKHGKARKKCKKKAKKLPV
jgi:subtilisin-like proprotein convertase family protein